MLILPLPVKENANFTFIELKHDTVLKISREEIINKTNIANKNSLKGITLTLGIYTENNDYTGSTPYAFKLFFPQMIKESPSTVIEIIPIRSDQKVQCLPFNYHDKNICLFSFTADDIDYKKNVIIYFRNKDDTIINIYSPEETPTSIAMINLDIFIIKMMNEFMGNPKNKINEKYVYLQNIDRFHSYFFVTFSEDNSDSIIEVYSSSQVFGDDITIYPNPSTPQIFATLGEKVNFNFVSTQDILVNIVRVSGKGSFYWDDEKEKDKKYYLLESNNRLCLSASSNSIKKNIVPLKVESKDEKDRFIFYLSYHPMTNVKLLEEGKNIDFHYRAFKTSLYYYIPLKSEQDLNINFNFYDFGLETNETLIYDTKLFNIWATIVSEKEAIKARTEPNYKPKYNGNNIIKGVIDSTYGNIFISQNDIKEIYKDQNEPASILFGIEKLNNIKQEFIPLGFELNTYSNKEFISVPEGIYITNKLSYSRI